mgnify:CR=1 FL=1
MGQLEGQYRFRAAVEIDTARGHPIATAARNDVGQNLGAVIAAQEPAIGRFGMPQPTIVTGRAPRFGGGIDRGPRFQRLLVEREVFVRPTKRFRSYRAEMTLGRNLLASDETQARQAAFEPVFAAERLARPDQGLRQARIIIPKYCFEPRPIRPSRSDQKVVEQIGTERQRLVRGGMVWIGLDRLDAAQHDKGYGAR